MFTAVQNQRVEDVESFSPRRGCAIRFQKSQPIGPVPTFYSPDWKQTGCLEENLLFTLLTNSKAE
jgi:hypothetical protein